MVAPGTGHGVGDVMGHGVGDVMGPVCALGECGFRVTVPVVMAYSMCCGSGNGNSNVHTGSGHGPQLGLVVMAIGTLLRACDWYRDLPIDS